MSKKRHKKWAIERDRATQEVRSGNSWWSRLQDETRNSIVGITLILFALILLFAAAGKGGYLGGKLYAGIHHLFGIGYYVLPTLFLILAFNFFRRGGHHMTAPALVAGPFFLLSALGLLALFDRENGTIGLGGWVGYWIMHPLTALFAPLVTGILLIGIFLIAILILFDTPLRFGFMLALLKRNHAKETRRSLIITNTTNNNKEWDEDVDEDALRAVEASNGMRPDDTDADADDELAEGGTRRNEEENDTEEWGNSETDATMDTREERSLLGGILRKNAKEARGKHARGNEGHAPLLFNAAVHEDYTPPPLSLLSGDKGKPGYGDIKANANIIKRTLQNFGISVEMDEVSVGPSITRYALKPAEGVRLAKITALQHDLELALAAAPIRIEAPIPGKSLVGIEMPNSTKSTVGLGTLLAEATWTENPNPLFVPLGKGISGVAHFMNIAKMPHLLVAGATGSGKSVAIHTLITSLLYRNSPERLRFIMVDPKRVELTLYNGIPHLLTPVITDAKKTILTLKWATKEMDRRYDVLQEKKCRDILSYHQNVLEPALREYEAERAEGRYTDGETPELPELMPYIVVIIDELADIMTAYPRELEAAIVRLAQMSRAVGIHLVLSTQRPSVNVITGLIKANIPARVALQVASQIDSRTILDMSGAENLLGAGDMLFLSAEMPKPVRLQSAFISESEVKGVVKFLKDHYDGALGDELSLTPDENRNAFFGGIPEEALRDDGAEAEDEMYEAAKDLVVKTQKASTSFLQRRLGLGYARAARIMDMLEEHGVIGPGDGAKPREVLLKPNDTEGFGREEE